jgi:SAM-dependent methyltransferase
VAGSPPPRPAPSLPPPAASRPRGLVAAIDPAWGAVHYPPGGLTAGDLAALVDNMVDAGSREHYADAALYDYEYRRRRADVSFYRELARRRGADRILELGAGTGRVTVPLARDGRQVVAVDRSPEMLARLTARVARLAPAAAARITPVLGDLRGFAVDGRFPLVIAAFNVFEHLYTRGEIHACLQQIAAHLEPGGALAFDVQLPDLAWLTRDASRRWARTRFTDPSTGRSMYYSTNHDYDPISQIAMIRLYYEPADEPGPRGGFPDGSGPRSGPAGSNRRHSADDRAGADGAGRADGAGDGTAARADRDGRPGQFADDSGSIADDAGAQGRSADDAGARGRSADEAGARGRSADVAGARGRSADEAGRSARAAPVARAEPIDSSPQRSKDRSHPAARPPLAATRAEPIDPGPQRSKDRSHPAARARLAGSGGVAPGGWVVQLSQRKFFPAELEALLAHAGFRVRARYGDFSFGPLTATADSQVLVCELVPETAGPRPPSR